MDSIQNSSTVTTGSPPSHGNHGIRCRCNQEADEGDRSRVAHFLPQRVGRASGPGVEVELLKNCSREHDAVRGLGLADGLEMGVHGTHLLVVSHVVEVVCMKRDD